MACSNPHAPEHPTKSCGGSSVLGTVLSCPVATACTVIFRWAQSPTVWLLCPLVSHQSIVPCKGDWCLGRQQARLQAPDGDGLPRVAVKGICPDTKSCSQDFRDELGFVPAFQPRDASRASLARAPATF